MKIKNVLSITAILSSFTFFGCLEDATKVEENVMIESSSSVVISSSSSSSSLQGADEVIFSFTKSLPDVFYSDTLIGYYDTLLAGGATTTEKQVVFIRTSIPSDKNLIIYKELNLIFRKEFIDININSNRCFPEFPLSNPFSNNVVSQGKARIYGYPYNDCVLQKIDKEFVSKYKIAGDYSLDGKVITDTSYDLRRLVHITDDGQILGYVVGDDKHLQFTQGSQAFYLSQNNTIYKYYTETYSTSPQTLNSYNGLSQIFELTNASSYKMTIPEISFQYSPTVFFRSRTEGFFGHNIYIDSSRQVYPYLGTDYSYVEMDTAVHVIVSNSVQIHTLNVAEQEINTNSWISVDRNFSSIRSTLFMDDVPQDFYTPTQLLIDSIRNGVCYGKALTIADSINRQIDPYLIFGEYAPNLGDTLEVYTFALPIKK